MEIVSDVGFVRKHHVVKPPLRPTAHPSPVLDPALKISQPG
jgi:hypothetical protein